MIVVDQKDVVQFFLKLQKKLVWQSVSFLLFFNSIDVLNVETRALGHKLSGIPVLTRFTQRNADLISLRKRGTYVIRHLHFLLPNSTIVLMIFSS